MKVKRPMAADPAMEATNTKAQIRRVVASREAITPPIIAPTHTVNPDTIAAKNINNINNQVIDIALWLQVIHKDTNVARH